MITGARFIVERGPRAHENCWAIRGEILSEPYWLDNVLVVDTLSSEQDWFYMATWPLWMLYYKKPAPPSKSYLELFI